MSQAETLNSPTARRTPRKPDIFDEGKPTNGKKKMSGDMKKKKSFKDMEVDLQGEEGEKPLLVFPRSGSASPIKRVHHSMRGHKRALSIAPMSSLGGTSTLGAGEQERKRKKRSESMFGLPRPDDTTPSGGKGKENIVVCVRMRPCREQPDPPIYITTDQSIALTSSHPGVTKGQEVDFVFDALVGPEETTLNLYNSRISQVVKAAMEGFNGTVFAYGQTASGKTHTMMGTEEQPGVIPLSVNEIFDLIAATPSREFLLRVSFLEIYKENLRDLLQSANSSSEAPPLKIHEDKKGRIYVGNLKEEIVMHAGQVLEILRRGGDERKVGETEWNERSSRSHAVFTMTIESRGREKGEEEVRISQLNLIDLAGSERAAAAEERRKEGAFINKSLLALGTVIAKLTEGKGTTHVPFRDSKLTRLLQTSLSGNARVAIVCAISPELQHGVETLSTLKFAQRAKMIVTHAERGVIMQEKTLLQKYMAEIEALKEQLQTNSDMIRVADPDDPSDDENELNRLNDERRKAEEDLQNLQLQRLALKEQIEHLNRHILTGPTVSANARRVSMEARSFILSPGKERSILGKEVEDRFKEMGVGLGSPAGRLLLRERRAASDVDGALEDSTRERRKEMEESENRLKERERKIEELMETIENISSQLDSLKVEKESLGTNYSDLQKELESARLERDDLQQSHSDLSETIEKFRQESTRLNSRVEELTSCIEHAEKGREELETVVSELKSENSRTEVERKDLEARLKDVESSLDDSSKTVEKLQSAAEDYQAQIAELEKRVEAEKEAVTKQLASWATEREELGNKLENLETELVEVKSRFQEQLSEAQQTISTLTCSLEEEKKTKETSEQELITMKQEKDSLERQLEESKSTYVQFEQEQTALREQADVLLKEKEESHAELQRTSAKKCQELGEEVSTHLQTIENLKATLDATQSELSETKENILLQNTEKDTQLQALQTSLATITADFESTQSAHSIALAEKEEVEKKLAAELEEALSSLTASKSIVEELQTSLDSLAEELRSLKSDHSAKEDALQRELTDLKALNASVEEQIEKDKAALLEVNTIVVQLEADKTNLESEVGKANEEREVTQKELEQCKGLIDSLEQQLDKDKTVLIEVQTSVSHLEQEKASLQFEADVMKQERDALQAELVESKNATEEVKQELEKEKSTLVDAQTTVADLQTKLEEESAKVKAGSEQLEILQNQLRESTLAIEKLEQDLEQERSSLAVSQTTITELESTKTTLEEEVSKLKGDCEIAAAELQEEKSTAEALMSKLETESNTAIELRAQLSELESQLQAETEKTKVELEAKLDLEKRLEESKELSESLEQQLEKDKTLLEEAQQLVADLELQLNDETDKHKLQIEQNANLEKELIESKAFGDSIQQQLEKDKTGLVEIQVIVAQLESDKAGLQVELERIKFEMQEKDTKLEEARSLKTLNDTLEQQLDKDHLALQEAQALVTLLQTEKSTLEANEEKLREETARQLTELEDLRSLKDAADAKEDMVNGQLKDLEQRVQEAQAAQVSMEKELKETVTKLDMALFDVEEWKASHLEIENENDGFKAEIETQQTEIATLTEQHRHDLEELEKAKREIETQRAEVTKLTEQHDLDFGEFEKVRQAMERGSDSISALESRCQELEAGLVEKEAAIKSLEEDKANKLFDINGISKLLEESRATEESLKAQLDDLQSKAKSAEDEMIILRNTSQKADLEGQQAIVEVKELKAKIRKLESQLRTGEDTISIKTREAKRLLEEIDELTSEMASMKEFAELREQGQQQRESELTARLTDLELRHSADMEAEKSAYRSTEAQLKKDIAAQECQMAIFQDKLAGLESELALSRDEETRLRNQARVKDMKISRLEDDISGLNLRLGLSQPSSGSGSSKAGLESLKNKILALQNGSTSPTIAPLSFSNSNRPKSRSGSTMELDLQRQIQDQQARIRELESQLADTQRPRSRSVSRARAQVDVEEYENLRVQHESLKQDYEELQKDLSKWHNQVAVNGDAISKLERLNRAHEKDKKDIQRIGRNLVSSAVSSSSGLSEVPSNSPPSKSSRSRALSSSLSSLSASLSQPFSSSVRERQPSLAHSPGRLLPQPSSGASVVRRPSNIEHDIQRLKEGQYVDTSRTRLLSPELPEPTKRKVSRDLSSAHRRAKSSFDPSSQY